MNQSTKISLLFYLIFLLGILSVFSVINKTLNNKSIDTLHPSTSIISEDFILKKY